MGALEYPHPEAGQPFQNPLLPPELLTGFVVGGCGHRVAQSEYRAGMTNCERCPTDREMAKRGQNGDDN